jgi:EmrB/QacA subfamily drug resistance transporter
MRVLSGAMLCILLAALDQTVVIPALPSIAHDLGAYKQLSWIVAAYLIASTISTPVYSKLSDLYGRRRLLLTCIALFLMTSVLCAVARSLDQLIWARALQGLGGGGLMALTQAAIADVMSPRERGRYQGYISAMWAIASVSGPFVGGIMTESLSWRWIFWLNLPIGAAAMWVCSNGLRRVAPPRLVGKPKLDALGALLLAGALSVLLLALGWGGNTYPWASVEIIGLTLGGISLLLALIWQERRAADPLLPPRLFASPTYVAAIIISTMTSAVMFMCLFTIPLYFQLVRGATAAQSGLYLAPFLLASATGNVIGSRWGRRFGTMRGVIRVASCLCCAGLVVLALLPHDTPSWTVIAVTLLAGPGVGGCLIGSMMSSLNALPPRDIGSGTGALLVLRSVGGASGSSLAGALLASGLSAVQHAVGNGASIAAGTVQGSHFGTVYAVAAACTAISFIVALRMPNTRLRETLQVAAASE